MDTQSIAAFIFILGLTIFFFVYKKRFNVVKIFYPVLYFAMYKTKLGLKLMDKSAKNWRMIVKTFSYILIALIILWLFLRYDNIISSPANGILFIIILAISIFLLVRPEENSVRLIIFTGFFGMVFIAYQLINNTFRILTSPEAMPGVGLVLPFEVKGAFYVPFFYWIASIFIIAIIHEFSHGVIARYYNIPLKSSGFAFLGVLVPVIPAAFVEPNEKLMSKRPTKEQLGVFSAGPVSNIITGVFFILLVLFISVPIMHSALNFDGVQITDFYKENRTLYPAEIAGIQKQEIIRKIDGIKITHLSNFSSIMQEKKPGETVSINTDNGDYSILLAEHPLNSSKPYLGVFVSQHTAVKNEFEERYGKTLTNILLWISGTPDRNGLFFWLYLLSLGIGFINLAPLGPLDGGKMLQTTLYKYFNKEKADKYWRYAAFIFLALLIINLGFAFIK